MLDELWRPLRAATGIVDRIDALTRLNRTLGLGDAKITHTLKDAESLGTEADKAKARGFVERAGMVVCAGLPKAEMQDLGQIVGLSQREIELVSSWSSPPGWAMQGEREEPPGRGRFLIKVGGRPGIPIRVSITDTERHLHDTNTRWVQNNHPDTHVANPGAGAPPPPEPAPVPGPVWSRPPHRGRTGGKHERKGGPGPP